MAKRRNTFALGLTVLVMFALFFSILIFIGVRPPWKDEKRPITIRFAHTLSIPPLEAGAPVQFAGQRVGQITGMWFEQGEHHDETTGKTRPMTYLYVRADVQDKLDLRADCSVSPEGPILGGAGSLLIVDQGTSRKKLEPNDVIEGEGMGGFAAVTEQVTELGGLLSRELDAKQKGSMMALIKMQLDASHEDGLMAELLAILRDIHTMTTNLRDELNPKLEAALLAKLHTTFDHINTITRELQGQMDPKVRTTLLGKLQVALDSINDALDDVSGMLKENRPAIRVALNNVKETTQTLNNGIAKAIAEELDSANSGSLMAKIHTSIDRLGSSLEDLNAITANTSEVITLNKGSVNKILANFTETSDHLKAATKDLRRNPWRLLYRPSLVETRELNIFDAARSFAEAASRLDDATARLKGLAEAHEGKIPADDPQLQVIRAELQETFQRFTEAETALWKSLNIQD